MPDHSRMRRFWPLAIIAICVMGYLARPAPVLGGKEISSYVISAAGDTARSDSYSIHDTFGQGPIGPVATDLSIRLYDGFWSTLAVAVPDTEPPEPLLTFEASPLDTAVYLEWLVPMIADLAGTLIRYSTTGFPAGPTDGTPVENGASGEFPFGSGQDFTHTELTNGVTYYYSAFNYDAARNYSAALTDSATPFDGVPPGGATIELPEPGDMQVTLRWTNPSDADFDHTLIRYSTVTYPSDPDDGSPVPNGNDGKFFNVPGSVDDFVHTGLVNNTKYYYTWFAADEVPNYSFPQMMSVTPSDIYPPGLVISASAVARADGSVKVRWTNPSDTDFEGVLIRYAVDHWPVSVSDGAPVENGAGGEFAGEPAAPDSFYHTGLVSDTTHYYAIFAYDEVPNYSGGVIVWARPHDETPPELSLSVFQNPYLTAYLDIYLVGSETLVDTSICCVLRGETIDMEVADAVENVWRGDYQLESAGIDTIRAWARDVNLNRGYAEHEFSSGLILKTMGGTAMSADGCCAVSIGPGAVGKDAYVLIYSKPRETPEMSRAYTISPPGLSLDGFAEISFAYAEEMGQPEHLGIVRVDGDLITPVDSYLDRERGRVLGFTDRLGTYGLLWRPDLETSLYGAGDFVVLQNVPNPFAGSTRIGYEIPRVGHVCADVITIDGRLIARIHDGIVIPGRHAIEWNGQDADGQRVASGVYFYRVQFDAMTMTKKMVHLR